MLVRVVERLVCMDAGRVIADGDPHEVMRDAAVIDAYLGRRGRMSLLAVERLDVRHGLLQAVRDVSLEVAEGETVALVGANGAGKTTLLRRSPARTGPTAGRVRFDGDGHHARARPPPRPPGIALVPGGTPAVRRPHRRGEPARRGAPARPGAGASSACSTRSRCSKPLRDKRAASLSGGEQQATAIGRALMTNPRLLLLDEVSLGLAPRVVDDVYRSLAALIGAGTTMLLVEQDLARALRSATASSACSRAGSCSKVQPPT